MSRGSTGRLTMTVGAGCWVQLAAAAIAAAATTAATSARTHRAAARVPTGLPVVRRQRGLGGDGRGQQAEGHVHSRGHASGIRGVRTSTLSSCCSAGSSGGNRVSTSRRRPDCGSCITHAFHGSLCDGAHGSRQRLQRRESCIAGHGPSLSHRLPWVPGTTWRFTGCRSRGTAHLLLFERGGLRRASLVHYPACGGEPLQWTPLATDTVTEVGTWVEAATVAEASGRTCTCTR